jgi:outer membrane protein W
MRTIMIAVLLFAASVVTAQEKPTSFTIFVTNPQYSSGSSSGSGYGVALRHIFPHGVSVELSAAEDTHYAYNTILFVSTERIKFHTHPINLDVAYNFEPQSSWKPYIGGGARYVDQRHYDYFVSNTSNHLSAEIVGGVTWQFAKSAGLRIDVKQAVTNLFADDAFKASIGIEWRW